MKIFQRILLGFSVILFLCSFSVLDPLPAESAINPHDFYEGISVNVRDYGAQGDGETDDTEAIRAAFGEASRRIKSSYIGPWEPVYSEVVFPEGVYSVSGMITLNNAAIMRGIGDVTIRQSNPDIPALRVHWALRILIENITFEGGRNSIHLFTANSAGAHITIRECVFRNTSYYAVECVMRAEGDGNWNAGFWRDDELVYGERYCFNSTVLHIDRSSFEDTMGVLHTNADVAVLSNSGIKLPPGTDEAAIVNANILKIENVRGIASPGKANTGRWIDNLGGLLVVQNSEFDSSSGYGMPLIHNHAKWRNTAGGGYQRSAIVENTTVVSAGSEKNVVVFCHEVPNHLAVRGVSETSGMEIDILGFENVPDEEYFQGITPDGLSYVIDARNSSNLSTLLPPSMQPFKGEPLPEFMEEIASFDSEQAVDYRNRRQFVKKVIDVSQFEVKGDGRTDNTSAIIEAVAYAAGIDGAELLFPPGWYIVNRTIELPPEISIRAAGSALFTFEGIGLDAPLKGGGPVFSSTNAERIFFSNLFFSRTDNAISVTGPADRRVEVLIDRCVFRNIDGMAVSVGTENIDTVEDNMIYFSITDSAFYYNVLGLFKTNATRTLFDTSWAVTDPRLEGGAIINRGSMHLRNICGNPVVSREEHYWIDNFHEVAADTFRFGGEGGGSTAVRHSAGSTEQGTVVIRNSPLYALHPHKAWVCLEKLPRLLIVESSFGLSGGGHGQRMLGFDGSAAEEMDQLPEEDWLHTSGNTICSPCERDMGTIRFPLERYR